ncbi:MAG: AraC family transcriptional regulator [Lachnospiraceae bacterium]|nr:AraC family transcriptional regulator [Lachnospiraceae bacterium]
MKDWSEAVQQMLNWLEDNPDKNNTLMCISKEVGYSPWYCSELFHDATGMTLKSYAAKRRLAKITEELRDSDERILDIAIKYGLSSQEALTRLFRNEFGCTPAEYRKHPKILPFQISKRVLFPDYDKERITQMEKARLAITVEHITAHKYLGVWEEKVDNYGEFWNYHSCEDVCGYVSSLGKLGHPIVTPHTAGWKIKDGKKIYFYGSGVELDYDGDIPEGFEIREFPESDYIVFSYPAFDYMKENMDVMAAVEELAWNYDPSEMGYIWNEDVCQCYQRHFPEKLGYQILRPVVKAK